MESQLAYEAAVNRRRYRRTKVLKAGRLIFNHGFSAMDCIVRNISLGGAMIDIPSVIGIPDHFGFSVGGETARLAEIVWRADHLAGVSYA